MGSVNESEALVPDAAVGDDASRALSAFASEANFAAGQRMAKALSASSLVPKEYQGPNGLPNVLIAMELASRIGASVFAVMQHLDIIHGRPSWRATFLIATVNACGRFTPLRFRWQGVDGTETWGCRAVAKDRESGDECVGPAITMAMAKAEGWSSKNGSKWRTMPDQMLCYRAASFWTRLYAPELSLGMHTTDEVRDIHGAYDGVVVRGDTKALEADLLGMAEKPVSDAEVERDPMTGGAVPPEAGALVTLLGWRELPICRRCGRSSETCTYYDPGNCIGVPNPNAPAWTDAQKEHFAGLNRSHQRQRIPPFR